MRRRDLVISFGGATLALCSVGRGQPRTVAAIGVLVSEAPGAGKFWRLFRDALRRVGYIEGQTVRFEFRSDLGQPARLPELAAELVRLKVDVIVTWFTPPAIAAKHATRDIPIVMAAAGDPVATALVASLSRPGGNVTGMSGDAGELAAKIMGFVRELLPSGQRVAALVNAPNPFSEPFLEQVRLAGTATGMAIDPIMVQQGNDLDAAFAVLEQRRPDAIMVQPSLPTGRVAQLAIEHRLPAVSASRGFVEAGGLISYWFDEADLYRNAAAIVDKVLKGTKPADVPVRQPTKFELVINLKTAKALGITVPQSLLARADEVIE